MMRSAPTRAARQIATARQRLCVRPEGTLGDLLEASDYTALDIARETLEVPREPISVDSTRRSTFLSAGLRRSHLW
jgi:hypothetical protein